MTVFKKAVCYIQTHTRRLCIVRNKLAGILLLLFGHPRRSQSLPKARSQLACKGTALRRPFHLIVLEDLVFRLYRNIQWPFPTYESGPLLGRQEEMSSSQQTENKCQFLLYASEKIYV